MRTVAENAHLALLLEVTGTPKPGNVDRLREYDDLRFEHFLAGAVGAQKGLQQAADGVRIGRAFESGVEGMSQQSAGNTQFGALLMLVPLVRTVASGRLSSENAAATVEATTIEDACGFYRAFEHVDVAVDDPPSEFDELDVRRGSDAIDTLRAKELTLFDVMELSADRDGVAAEWVSGFRRSFEAADLILQGDGPICTHTSEAFIRLLADQRDTFVVTRNGEAAADEATQRAQAVLDGEEDADALAEEFVERDINPGTTADLTAAALFIALEQGLEI